MSTRDVEKAIIAEISKLNVVIDRKIISGLSYKNEAKRHKFLKSSLANLRKEKTFWLSRSFLFRKSFSF